MGDEDDHPQKSRKWLEDLSIGLCHEVDALTLQGLQIEVAQKGLIRCKFLIPKHLTDRDGNWHVGAIAVLIDDVGAAAVFSFAGHIKVSVSFNISYFSTAKIQEEVEIEAKVVGHKHKLSMVVVTIRKRDDGGGGEMIALGKLWMSSVALQLSQVSSKL